MMQISLNKRLINIIKAISVYNSTINTFIFRL